MKRSHLRFICQSVIILVIFSLAALIVACSSTTTPTTTPTPTLSSFTVIPASPANLEVGSNQQFGASGKYSDGSSVDFTSQITWASSDTNIATIDSSGLATGVAAGNTEIRASWSGVTSPAVTLTVIVPVKPTLSSIAVTPSSPGKLPSGSTQQFTATGTYSDGSTAEITSQVTWVSDNSKSATIDSAGLATGVASGKANITASQSGITSPPVTLPSIGILWIAVTPKTPNNLAIGATQQFTAKVTYSDYSNDDITSQATWTSDTISVATIDATGLATGISAGNTGISAKWSGVASPAVTLKVS